MTSYTIALYRTPEQGVQEDGYIWHAGRVGDNHIYPIHAGTQPMVANELLYYIRKERKGPPKLVDGSTLVPGSEAWPDDDFKSLTDRIATELDCNGAI